MLHWRSLEETRESPLCDCQSLWGRLFGVLMHQTAVQFSFTNHGLAITNTMFEHKVSHKCTWYQNTSVNWLSELITRLNGCFPCYLVLSCFLSTIIPLNLKWEQNSKRAQQSINFLQHPSRRQWWCISTPPFTESIDNPLLRLPEMRADCSLSSWACLDWYSMRIVQSLLCICSWIRFSFQLFAQPLFPFVFFFSFLEGVVCSNCDVIKNKFDFGQHWIKLIWLLLCCKKWRYGARTL